MEKSTHIQLEHLEYPDATMYDMIARMAAKYPKEPAYEFYGVKTSYADFLSEGW